MKLIIIDFLSLFAFASGFSIPSTLYICSTSTSHSDLRYRISSNHLLRGTKLFNAKIPLINRNESNVEVEDADTFMLDQAQMSEVEKEMPGSSTFLMNIEADALFAALNPEERVHHIDGREDVKTIMRPPLDPKVDFLGWNFSSLSPDFNANHVFNCDYVQ